MSNASAVALFLGILTAFIGRLRPPYVSAVWCSLVAGSIGLWIIGLSLGSTVLRGIADGAALHFLFAFTFVLSAFALEHVAEFAANRRLS